MEVREELMASIPMGRENAKTAKDLAAAWGTTTRGVRGIISKLREDGKRICSGQEGYWEAESIEEMYECVKRIRVHALKELKSVSKMRGDLIIAGYKI